MKRLLAAVLCLLALCACGRGVPLEETTEATTEAMLASDPATQPTTEARTLPTVIYPASYKDAPAAYKPVLDELYKYIQLTKPENWYEYGNQDYINYVRGETHFVEATRGRLGYAVKDINKDGIPELVILTDDYYGSEKAFIYTLFTLKDNKPLFLEHFWSRSSGEIAADGTIHSSGSSSAESGSNEIYILEPHAAALTLVAGYEYDHWPSVNKDIYYKMVNGERVTIDEKEYQSILKQYADPDENPMKLNFIPIEQ